MDTLPEDKQVVELISKLKYSSGAYPKDMLSSRRQQFIRQLTNAGLGIGITAGIKDAAKQSQGAGTAATTVTGKIIETVLIAAIAIEVGTTAYIYRQKIADFFKTFTGSPDASETIQPPDNNSSYSEPVILPTLTVPPTSETPVATLSPFETALPPVILQNNNNSNNSNNNSNTTAATPTPVPTDRNGNHYGQTPRPEQTQDSNGTNNNGTNGNSNN